MQRFRIADDLIDISESFSEMSKSVANEPSLGLFYVQKHVHSAVPNLISLRETVAKKFREITLQTEDLEDSISMVKSMEVCGSQISDEMIKDISDSLSFLSDLQHRPRTGSIGQYSTSDFWILQSGSSEIGSSSSSGNENRSYVSSIFRRAKQRAKNFTWGHVNDGRIISTRGQSPSPIVEENTSIVVNGDADELPLSNISQEGPSSNMDERADFLKEIMKYEDFRANKKANLEQWLEERNTGYDNAG